MKNRDTININCSRHPDMKGTKLHCDYNSSGGSRDGYGGSSRDGGGNWGGSVSNSFNTNITRTSIDSSSGLSTYNSIIEMSKKGYVDGKRFMGERIMNLKSANLTDDKVGQLMFDLKYEGLKLDMFDVSYNNLSNIATNSIFFNFSNHRSGTSIYDIKFINLSNNNIGDEGAKRISEYLSRGDYSHLKALDVSGNQISTTGKGYFAKAMEGISQDLIVTLDTVKGFSKDAFKSAVKGMLYVAKSNGISTKEMVTTDETINYCKKGIGNISFNIFTGYLKCTSKVFKLYNYKDITPGDVAGEILGLASQPIKAVLNFTCITENTAFSIVDQAFSNCLIGVDSLLNE